VGKKRKNKNFQHRQGREALLRFVFNCAPPVYGRREGERPKPKTGWSYQRIRLTVKKTNFNWGGRPYLRGRKSDRGGETSSKRRETERIGGLIKKKKEKTFSAGKMGERWG